jgi:hypothetical protein
MRGFTIFDIIIVLLILTVVAIVAIPDALSRITAREENRVFATLQRLAVAEQRFRKDRVSDANGDGKGEYGFLDALLAPGPDGRPRLSLHDAYEINGDHITIGAFHLAVLLPDAEGFPVPPSAEASVDPRAAAESFLAVAWPVRMGQSAYRAYAVNHELLISEQRNEKNPLTGPDLPSFPPLVLREPNTDRILLAPFWTIEWERVLPHAQAKFVRSEAERLGLPLPEIFNQD